MGLDISQQQSNILSKIQALKTYNDVSDAEKNIFSKAGSSLSEVSNLFSSQLDKASETQKRYQKNAENSMDRMLNMILSIRGSGEGTMDFLKRTFIKTLVEIKPKIKKILEEETLKSLGCSQEQTFNGININNVQIPTLSALPIEIGNYISLQSIDLSGTLKINPNTWLGKIFYTITQPSGDQKFIPFGGSVPFPMNKFLRDASLEKNKTFEQFFGKNYNGKSGQPIFDINYTDTDKNGLQGNFMRVFLLDREDSPKTPDGVTLNSVGQFINDYFATIDLISVPQVVASVVNYLTSVIDIKANVGFGELDSQSKFALILNRILGLCFDERQEIDVSGISKIGELDGIDDSFFEFTEVDLRNIEFNIANAQKGVVVYEDCDNIEIPVDVDKIVNQLIDLNQRFSLQTKEQQIESINNIINSIPSILLPNSVSLKVAIDRNFLKKLPIAIVSAVLSPEVLLGYQVMLNELESLANKTQEKFINEANNLIQSANSVLQSGTTFGQKVTGQINGGVDFAKKNKTFVINLTARINEIFLETLFEIIKRDIFFLIDGIIKDIEKSQVLKKYAIILRLVQVGYIVARFIRDKKRCKSLLDEISLLLSLISSTANSAGLTVPPFLNIFAALLPGFSPERAVLNLIENLEKLGIPTGPLPDGSANVMNLFAKSLITGMDQEESENGKVLTSVTLPPPFGLVPTFGKKF